MTDPTIPELIARLRELHAKLQALQVGTPEFTAARQLFRDVLQLSAPGILDALDHLESLTTWRPIETAPRDGTEVALLFAREETVTFGVLSTWPRVRAAFFTGSDWSIPYYANNPPIGWTPLPAPPAAEGGEGG